MFIWVLGRNVRYVSPQTGPVVPLGGYASFSSDQLPITSMAAPFIRTLSLHVTTVASPLRDLCRGDQEPVRGLKQQPLFQQKLNAGEYPLPTDQLLRPDAKAL